MAKLAMLEKLKKAFTTSCDIMLAVSQLEEAIYREDEEKIKEGFKNIKVKLKELIKNLKEEKNGYH